MGAQRKLMLFCPDCANQLQCETIGPQLRFCCPTCAYVHELRHKITRTVFREQKQVEEVLGDDDAWKHRNQVSVPCEECGNIGAYYTEVQIRSSDEPATIFYRCTNSECKHMWREG